MFLVEGRFLKTAMYQPSNITEQQAIHKELETMQSFLEAQYSADNPAAVMDRFNDLAIYMARSGKLKADAEWHYNSLVESSLMAALKRAHEQTMSPSTLNKYIESLARDAKYLVSWADRVNRSCTHQHDGLRSVISSLRAEMMAQR